MDEIHELLENFKLYLQKNGKARKTISSYCCSVELFFSLYRELSVERLHAYRRYLLEHYALNTVNSRIFGMNCFLKYLPEYENPVSGSFIEPFLFQKPPYRMQAVKLQKKTFSDTVISQRDYERLKKGLKQDQNMYWYFVVRFLCATGARISELLQIKMEDIELGYLDIYSKGGKIRRLYLPKNLCREAVVWFQAAGIESGFIFLNRNGRLITPRGIELRLKSLAVRYRIDPDTVYPHSFRHRFAKNFLKKFNDISLLADLMGHDSIETTRIYLTKSSKEQKTLLDRIITW